MMLYEGDARRCRRCKRRRMDDEPPEVQQYKTCAKCRIIERTKKKLRKPLAEETMRYGMRQFQEQNQNANFIHDDIFSNDLLMNDIQSLRDMGVSNPAKQLYNAQFSMYKQPTGAPPAIPNNGNYTYGYANGVQYPNARMQLPQQNSYQAPQMPQMGMGQMPPNPGTYAATPTSSATAAAIAAAAIKRSDLGLSNVQPLDRLQNYFRQYQEKNQGDSSRMALPTKCEHCAETLDSDDTLSMIYRLCRVCYTDPYSKANLHRDFTDFLAAVQGPKAPDSVSFISEFTPYVVESLSNNRAINSEEQFRKLLLDTFTETFLDPLMGLMRHLKFSRVSQNVAEVNQLPPIVSKVNLQYYYISTPPIRSTYIANYENGSTHVEFIFMVQVNVAIIKLSTKSNSQGYDAVFLKTLDEKMRAKGFTFDESPGKIYPYLGLPIERQQFEKDFKSLEKQISEVRAKNKQEKPDAKTDVLEKTAEDDDNTPVEDDESDNAENESEVEKDLENIGKTVQVSELDPAFAD